MSKEEKKLTTAEGLKARTIFATLADATQFLGAQADRLADWGEQTFVAPATSVDAEGNPTFDPTYWESPDREIMVATLKNKIKGGVSSMKAVVMAPIPTLEALIGAAEELADSPGVAFVREIIRKELNHRAVRPLRVVDDPRPAASSMPLSIDSFITSQRETGGLLESFDQLYKKISDTLTEASKAWKKRKLTKSDIRKAMESKGYALEMFPELEEASSGSLFVLAINLGIKAAEREGLDPAIFKHWLDNRDSVAYDVDEDEDEDLSLDSLLDDMLAEPEAEESADEEAEEEADAEQADA